MIPYIPECTADVCATGGVCSLPCVCVRPRLRCSHILLYTPVLYTERSWRRATAAARGNHHCCRSVTSLRLRSSIADSFYQPTITAVPSNIFAHWSCYDLKRKPYWHQQQAADLNLPMNTYAYAYTCHMVVVVVPATGVCVYVR